MPTNFNQKGSPRYRFGEAGIAHLLAILIILAGIVVGVILVKNPTFFFPGASEKILSPANEAKRKSYEIHSFIFPNLSTSNKSYLFDAAKRTHKRIVRFDFILSDITPKEGVFDFAKTDENIALASGRGLEVLGVLHQTSPWMVDPNLQRKFHGPILESKLPNFREAIKKIVVHYPKVNFWEIWNEPDLNFGGTAADYAKMLNAAYSSIKEVNPQAQVLMGGVTTTALGSGWLQKVLQDPVNPGKNNYDVANIHISGPIASLPNLTKKALEVYQQYGKQNAPLWITEHGYPADPALQAKRDSNYASGEQSQGDFYQKSLPLLLDSGATKVFLTLRDMSTEESKRPCSENPFCSEGLVTFPSRENSAGRRDRLSMEVFQKMLAPGQDSEQVGTTGFVPGTDSLGTVGASSLTCPTGSIAGECFNLNVSCSGTPAIQANVKFSKASNPKGTVILQTGGGAEVFYERDFEGGGAAVVRDIIFSGFSTAQISWSGSRGWLLGPGGPRKLSCRFATVSKWIYDNLHQGNTNNPFCATGNSGGAGAIAQSMAHYGLASILDAAVLSGGPVFSRVDKGCFQESATHLSPCGDRLPVAYSDANLSTLDGTYQNNTCSSKREANRQTLLNDSQLSADGVKNFPTTSVHMVVGDRDKGSGPGQGLEWANEIFAASKTLDCAKDTPHAIAQTPSGAKHIIEDIKSFCRLQTSPKPSASTSTSKPSSRASSTPSPSSSTSPAPEDDESEGGSSIEDYCPPGSVAAYNIQSGECRKFSNVCDIPGGWVWGRESECPGQSTPSPTPRPTATSQQTSSPQPTASQASSTQVPSPSQQASSVKTPIPSAAPIFPTVTLEPFSPIEFRTAIPFAQPAPTPEPPTNPVSVIISSIRSLFSNIFNTILSPFR